MGRSQFGSTLLVTQSENCIHVCTLRAGGHKARSPAMAHFLAAVKLGMILLGEFMVQS